MGKGKCSSLELSHFSDSDPILKERDVVVPKEPLECDLESPSRLN